MIPLYRCNHIGPSNEDTRKKDLKNKIYKDVKISLIHSGGINNIIKVILPIFFFFTHCHNWHIMQHRLLYVICFQISGENCYK